MNQACLPSTLARRVRRLRALGFTMAEMLAVIAIIGILAVTAAPVFTGMMRDRRVNRASMQLVDYYRLGRTRAMGRGIPVLVSWNAAGGAKLGAGTPKPSGLIVMQEPVVTTVAASTNCSTTVWVAPTNNPIVPGPTHEISRFDIGNGLYDYTQVEFLDELGATQTTSEICFSSTGRSFIRSALGGAGGFTPIAAVPRFIATNQTTGIPRTIFIPPNGIARIGL